MILVVELDLDTQEMATSGRCAGCAILLNKLAHKFVELDAQHTNLAPGHVATLLDGKGNYAGSARVETT